MGVPALTGMGWGHDHPHVRACTSHAHWDTSRGKRLHQDLGADYVSVSPVLSRVCVCLCASACLCVVVIIIKFIRVRWTLSKACVCLQHDVRRSAVLWDLAVVRLCQFS